MVKKIRQYLIRIGLIFILVIPILMLFLLGLARLATPLINDYRPQTVAWVLAETGFNIHIENIKGDWHWFQPMLRCYQLTISPTFPSRPLGLKIEEVDISLDLIQSLFHWSPEIGILSINGTQLDLTQSPTGTWNLAPLVSPTTPHQPTHFNALLNWLLTRDRITLKQINLRVQPLGGPPLILKNLRLHLVHFAHEHLLEMQSDLWQGPETSAHIELFSHIMLNANKQPKAKTYLLIKNLWLLPQWNRALSLPYQIRGHLSQLSLSLLTQGWEPKQAVIRLSGEKVNLKRRGVAKGLYLKQLLMGLDLSQLGTGWHSQVSLWTELGKGLIIQHQLTVALSTHSDSRKLEAEMDQINLSQIALFLPLLPEGLQTSYHEKCERLGLKGIINQPSGFAEWNKQGLMSYAFQSQVNHLSWLPLGLIPGFQEVNGDIRLNQKGGRALLNSNEATADFPHVFREPIDNLSFEVPVTWQYGKEAFRIQTGNLKASVPAGKVEGQLKLIIPNAPYQPTDMDLKATVQIQNLKPSDIHRFLPFTILSPSLVTWLEQHILSLGPTQASVIIQGPLSNFPFAQGGGAFSIRGAFSNLTILPAINWPLGKDLSGNLAFEGNSMHILVNKGQWGRLNIQGVNADIPDFSASDGVTLQMKGQSVDQLENLIDFIRHSPLNPKGLAMNTLIGAGPFNLDLALTLPLADITNYTFQGALALDKASLSDEIGLLQIQNLNGIWNFNQKKITTTGFDLTLEGSPLHLQTLPYQNNQDYLPPLAFELPVNIDELTQKYHLPLTTIVQGKTLFTGTMALDNQNQFTFETLSNLKGLTVHFPILLAKSPNDLVPFHLGIQGLWSNLMKGNFSYGKVASALFTFKIRPQFLIQAAHFVLGTNQTPQLPAQGTTLTLDLPFCSPAIWEQLRQQFKTWDQSPNLNHQEQANLHYLGPLNPFTVRCQQLSLGTTLFSLLDFSLKPQDKGWDIGIKGSEIEGHVQLPPAAFSHTIEFNFNQLTWPRTNNSPSQAKAPTAFAWQPGDWPLLKGNINHFAYGQWFMGLLQIQSIREPIGGQTIQLQLSQAKALGGNITLVLAPNPPLLRVKGNLNSTDLNSLAKAWHVPANIIADTANLTFDLTFNNLVNPLLTSASGTVSIRLNNGMITGLDKTTDAKVGIGQLLTLLSLQALPGRLHNSYSEQGFPFNHLEANLTLSQGTAKVQEAILDSTLAKLSIKGNLDLDNQTYHLILFVVPHVTASVPVAATLVGGPIVGAVAWVADKVLSPALNAVTATTYSITGPWAHPIMQKMTATQEVAH